MKRTQRAVAATVPLALALSLAACSSDDDSSSTAAGEVSYPTVPYTTPGEGISLGHDDQEIGDTIPEPVHVSEIQPASENDLLAVLRTPGGLEIGVNVLDPVTGVAGSRIVVGPGIWDPVIHGFVGESSSDPAVRAARPTSPSPPTRATCSSRTRSNCPTTPARTRVPDPVPSPRTGSTS